MLSKELNMIRHDLQEIFRPEEKDLANEIADMWRRQTNFYVRVSRITEDDVFNSYDISEDHYIIPALNNVGCWGLWVSTLERGM